MGSIDKKLKAYVRYDGSGRVVAGSLILRKKKPKVGKWVEIPAFECCVSSSRTLVTTRTVPLTFVSVSLLCNDVVISTAYTSETANTMEELIILLNTNVELKAYGTYSAIGPNTVQLEVLPSVKQLLCPNGIMSFTIFSD